MRHLPYVAAHHGAHFKIVPADAPSDAVDHGQAAGTDARPVDARADARAITAVDAAGARTNAWPVATANAVDVVCRRRHLVLRLVLAERLRLRRSKIKTLQGEEHGRRPHRARCLPLDVRHLRRCACADARAHSSTRARGDARTFITPDAAGPIPNAAPHTQTRYDDIRAVRVVRRRRDVVLRHEGLQHLRLRRPQTQTLQSQEHGRFSKRP